jgi:hypothetical protein
MAPTQLYSRVGRGRSKPHLVDFQIIDESPQYKPIAGLVQLETLRKMGFATEGSSLIEHRVAGTRLRSGYGVPLHPDPLRNPISASGIHRLGARICLDHPPISSTMSSRARH